MLIRSHIGWVGRSSSQCVTSGTAHRVLSVATENFELRPREQLWAFRSFSISLPKRTAEPIVIPSMIVTVVRRFVSFCRRCCDLNTFSSWFDNKIAYKCTFKAGNFLSQPVKVDQIDPICDINDSFLLPSFNDSPPLEHWKWPKAIFSSLQDNSRIFLFLIWNF